MSTQTQPSSSAPSKRRASLLATAIGGGLLLAFAVTHAASRSNASEAHAAAPSPGPRVTVASVEERLLADSDEITGHVEATETVELRARVSGHLDSVNFQAGQLVKAGDLLFMIDPRWYRAQFDLASARADVAEREAKRADELLAAQAISAEEADARHARLAEARAEQTTARLDLEHTEVRAPISGRISRALITAGNLVSGNPGDATLLTTIVSVGEAFVYADIDEETLLRFNRVAREGRAAGAGRVPVDLELADETGYPRHGYIESSDNRVNPDTGTLTLRMVFPNADEALVPGLFARVRVPIGAPSPRFLVSERAIETDQSQKFVLVVGPDRVASYRSVRLGGSVEGKRIVIDGLHAGDRIIVNGLQRVRPGMKVDPEPAVASAAPAGMVVAAR